MWPLDSSACSNRISSSPTLPTSPQNRILEYSSVTVIFAVSTPGELYTFTTRERTKRGYAALLLRWVDAHKMRYIFVTDTSLLGPTLQTRRVTYKNLHTSAPSTGRFHRQLQTAFRSEGKGRVEASSCFSYRDPDFSRYAPSFTRGVYTKPQHQQILTLNASIHQ